MTFAKPFRIPALFLLFFFLPRAPLQAGQDQWLRYGGPKYEWAGGVRFGSPLAASLKHFFKQNLAYEVSAGYYRYNDKGNWTQVAAALLYHTPISNDRLLSWYGGGGLSAMYWYFAPDWGAGVFPKTTSALFLQTGLDYKFKRFPINLGVDWTPYFQFSGVDKGLGISYGALCLRYVFK